MGFDPVSIAVGSAVIGAVGSGVKAFGDISGAEAKSANDAYQAQVAANNAKIAATDAKLDIQAGEVAAVNVGMKTRSVVGQEKAAQGAAGIEVNNGSAADVRSGTAALGMLDALTVRSNAAKQAYAKEVEATSDTAQGQLLQTESQQDLVAGDVSAAGDLLSGASSVGKAWAGYQTKFGTA